MIAYVSSLTNGGSDHLFHDPLLNQQAEWERRRPVKPILDALFQGSVSFLNLFMRSEMYNF